MSWPERKARLGTLINSKGDEEEDALALDKLLHGQSVIGQTPRTKEVDSLRFSDKDLAVIGTLERGQFGVIHLVTCKLDRRVYVCKSIEKAFAQRSKDHCSPLLERSILLRALKSSTPWAPHLFCAFQSTTHLNIVMDYAEGGSLQDVLESSPLDGRVSESDLRWWCPQIVSALNWCHQQGFAHRDIKPNNFVLTSTRHIQLIDFGSAAPLLPPDVNGRRQLPKEFCFVPCGTCDYISPEILLAHERALVRMEMEADEEESSTSRPRLLDEDDDASGEEGYGAETDWWSVGSMLYEMAYGITPFFAESVQTTYFRIMDHETNLKFDRVSSVSGGFKRLLKGLLTHAGRRLGRRGTEEVINHAYFESIDWDSLHQMPAPPSLHVPEFAYETPIPNPGEDLTQTTVDHDISDSQPIHWSAHFQSSTATHPSGHNYGSLVQNTPGVKSILRTPSVLRSSVGSRDAPASFIGFSWGPRRDIKIEVDAATDDADTNPFAVVEDPLATPVPAKRKLAGYPTPLPSHPASVRKVLATPRPIRGSYATPARTVAAALAPPPSTLRRGTGSTPNRRTVNEREAMKQLLDCVGMSARKRVIASGRKPRILASELFRAGPVSSRSRNRSTSLSQVSVPSFRLDASSLSGNLGRPQTRVGTGSLGSGVRKELRFDDTPRVAPPDARNGTAPTTDGETDTDTDVPPSPSPSPRPGSAMSMMSRRSATPTALTLTFGSTVLLRPPAAPGESGFNSDDERSSRRSPSPGLRDGYPSAESIAPDGSTRDVSPNGLPPCSPLEQEANWRMDSWEEMQVRHERLMSRIEDLQARLSRIHVR